MGGARATIGAGSMARGVIGGAARAAWPLAAGMGLLNFLGTEGGVGDRLKGVAAGFGIGSRPGPDMAAVDKRVEKIYGTGTSASAIRAGTTAGVNREAELTRLLRKGEPGETVGWTGGSVGAGQPIQGPSTRISGNRRKEMEEEVLLLRAENTARKDVIATLDAQRAEHSQSNARTAFEGDVKALQIVAKKKGRSAGVKAFTSDTMRSIGRRQDPKGRREQGNLALDYLDQLREKYPKLSDEYDAAASKIERRLRALGDHVVVINGRIYSSTASAWKDIAQSMGSNAERALERTSKAFTEIQRQAAQGLVDMGYSRADANKVIRSTESITNQNPNISAQEALTLGRTAVERGKAQAAQAKTYRARGGRIRGRGLMDTVPLVDGSAAAPGELIVNRHTEDEHDADARAYGLPSLAQRINGQRRPHSAPRRRTRHTDAYRLGGRYEGAGVERGTVGGGVNLRGANAGLAPYAALGASYGLHVTSGLRPGSITNAGNVSLHSSGAAIDVAGSASGMMSYGKAMAEQYGTGLDELIHTPMGFGIKNGAKVAPYAAADHFDHVHVGDRTPGGAFGPVAGGPSQASAGGFLSIPLLTAQKSGLGGIPGAMADRAIEIYTAGINQRLQSVQGSPGGAPGAMPGGDVDAWLTQALQITGQYSAANLSALRGRAMQESNGNPLAQNNWDSNAKKGIPSKGLLQTIDPTFQAHALPGMQDIWNPVHNAVAAIRYMLTRYGHIVAANGQGYATGGRTGSDFFRKALGTPSLFANKSTGGEIKVSVSIANVNVGSDGNAGAVGAQIGEQVAAKLAGALRKAAVI